MLKGKILIIDDEPKILELLSRIVSLEGYHVYQAQNAKKGFEWLEQEKDIQLVLCDVKLPDKNGLEVLGIIKNKYPLCEVILLTAYGTIHDGVTAMKLGAFDYLTKGEGDEQLIVIIDRAIEKVKLKRRINDLEHKLKTKYSFEQIIGHSEPLKDTISLAKKVAVTDSTVLIEGETGTGKELFAQSVHNISPRKNKPFVAVNCSAFPKDLLESEMFGYKKGAFTGANADKKGLFEEANEGTLFLDEVSEMNIDLQVKLLRVIEEQTFIKIGESKLTRVNVRIIAASNKDLQNEYEKGNFREDLYFRLAGFRILIPPLRQRREDIPELAGYFLDIYCSKINKKIAGLSKEFIEKLKNYEWKGNVRELKNVIERAVILAEADAEITPAFLPYEILSGNKTANTRQESKHDVHNESLADIEKEQIQKVLSQTNGNKTKAAKMLGIGLTTLYRKIEEYKIN